MTTQTPIALNWVTFTRRTDDPKLAYLEHRLTQAGIFHRRNGSSFHAPILEVPVEYLDAAEVILAESRPDLARRPGGPGTVGRYTLDDALDDHAEFAGYEPHDWTPQTHQQEGGF